MIQKILIANRGEIAVRIIHSCKIMGIKTVAAYSKCDKDSFAVFLADESVCIGDNNPSESYLNTSAIITAAKQKNCDAIHPGYGFLSEDPEFAQQVTEAGLVFIGPSPEVLSKTFDKVTMKSIAKRLRCPIIPDATKTDKYPIMIKASHGGGGMGIKIVNNKNDYEKCLKSAQSEVQSGFSNAEIMHEKIIDVYKHIDIQFVADKYGKITLFPARDCSIQQNFQKIIEETPAPNLLKSTLAKMEQDALNIISKVKYDNVGTVEFLLKKDMDYCFLEINSRLQVEHTITEEVTGIDLVEQQIRMATGEHNKLPEKISAKKHAIECRLRATSLGEINVFNIPAGKDIRFDTFIYQGYEMKPYYDALIGKIIVSDKRRENAIKKMEMALDETIIRGAKTNVDELFGIVSSPNFKSGKYSIFR